jgi:GDPmannose 4,6-dehydratase
LGEKRIRAIYHGLDPSSPQAGGGNLLAIQGALMHRRALITGVLGQDGAYLAKFLLEQGYEVIGGARRNSADSPWRLSALGIESSVKLVPFDLLEITNMMRMIEAYQPDELYNLAAQSFVGVSFEQPLLTADIDGIGAVRILEILRTVRPKCRFYQASTSEMYGKAAEIPQTEATRFHPRSPYGAAKVYAHYMTMNYREAHDMFACSGILFNHESPLRGPEFVTRKITLAMARLRYGGPAVELGNLEAKRDWGFAGDYVKAMWKMLQQPQPDDYVIATGEARSVQEFAEAAGNAAGFDAQWEGAGIDALCRDRKSGKVLVRVNKEFYRPAEVDHLIGDASKAKRKLAWRPEVGFHRLVEMMVEADLERVGRVRA